MSEKKAEAVYCGIGKSNKKQGTAEECLNSKQVRLYGLKKIPKEVLEKKELLKNKNIGKLYLAVSHMTVNWPTPKLYKIFDKIFTTNSKGLNYLIDTFGKPITNLEIINLFKDGI